MVAKLCAQSFPLEICRHAKNELLRIKKNAEDKNSREVETSNSSNSVKKRHSRRRHHRLNILRNHDKDKTRKDEEEKRKSGDSANTAEDGGGGESDDNYEDDDDEVEATPEMMSELDFGRVLTKTYMEMDALLESTGKLTPPKDGSIENALKHLPIGNPSMAMSGIERKNMFDFTGSTAVVAAIRNGVITVANCGDSRAVLCRSGRAVELSHDHKPESPSERRRIENAGGSNCNLF